MSTAWTSIRSDIRVELEEAVAAVYTDVILLAWWNEGQSDFARRSRALTDEQFTDTAPGQQSYVFPNKTTEVMAANYKDGALTRCEYPEFAQLTASGTPTHYAVWQDALYIYPIPSSAATGLLYVQRFYEPAELGADDSTNLSTRDIMAIKSYVKMRAYEMSGDLQMSEWHRKQYEQSLYERKLEALRQREGGHAHEPGIVW